MFAKNLYMETKLEQLINSTPFNELSVQEKEYVLTQITEIEYNQFFEIIASSKVAFESEFIKIEPENRVKANLTNAFKAKHNESFLDKLMVFLSPLFRTSVLKPVLAFGIIAIFFYIMLPKEVEPIEIAEIKNQKPPKVKEIVKNDIIEPPVITKPVMYYKTPSYKKTDVANSEVSDEDFLAGTANPLIENENLGLNCEFGMLMNEDTFISMEEFISCTTIQNFDVDSEELIINPEDLK